MKIYVAVVEELKKKEKQGETQETINFDNLLSFTPPWMLMYLFVGFLKISPCVWPNTGS